MQPPIGYRVWDAKDSLFTTTKDTDLPSSWVANNVSQSYVAIGFRFVLVSHRVVSAILFLIASGYWMGEADQLRMPSMSGNPMTLAHQAWLLFFVAILLDLIYSTILTIGALGSVFLPSAASQKRSGLMSYFTKDALISIYAEMGSYADIFRYAVQMVTSIVILIFAVDAMNLHNVYGDCEPIQYDAGVVPHLSASETVPTFGAPTGTYPSDSKATYADFRDNALIGVAYQAQRAVWTNFYRVRRLANTTDGIHDLQLSNTPMDTTAAGVVDGDTIKMGAGTCTVTATKGGISYHTCVMAIAVTLLIRFLINTFGLWCIFAADRPYYIFPYTCAGQRKRMGQRIQKRYNASTDKGERSAIEAASNASNPLNSRLVAAAQVDPQVPVVPVQGMQDADPESVQAAIVPELSQSMTCGGWIEPFWYNILGSLRMHEYVAYILYIFAFFILAGALNTSVQDATYIPRAADTADKTTAFQARVLNANQPMQYANYYTSTGETCSFFYNPNDPVTAKYAGSLYAPASKYHTAFDKDSGSSTETMNKLSEHFYPPALQACTQDGANGVSWAAAFYNGGSFPSGCCATDKTPTPYENVFNTEGEQTNAMYVFSILVLIGSIFYLISSLAYAAAIFGLNQAPIPQITLNSADPALFDGM